MATEEDVKDAIKHILFSRAMYRINFAMSTIRVDYAGLRSIVGLLNSGKIHVSIKSQRSGVSSSYDYGSNTISVPSSFSIASFFNRQDIVHQCTLAMHDAYWGGQAPSERGSGATTRTEALAAAYVAGSIYWFESKPPPSIVEDSIREKANDIAQYLYSAPDTRVRSKDELELRARIAADPIYKDKMTISTLSMADGV